MKSLAFLLVALIGVTAATFFRPAVPFQIENLGHIVGRSGYYVDTKDLGLDNPGTSTFLTLINCSFCFGIVIDVCETVSNLFEHT